MSADSNYYYDFSGEKKIRSFVLAAKNEKTFLHEYTGEIDFSGEYILLWSTRKDFNKNVQRIDSVALNGKKLTPSLFAYIDVEGIRSGIKIFFEKGDILTVYLYSMFEDPSERLFLSLLEPPEFVPAPEKSSSIFPYSPLAPFQEVKSLEEDLSSWKKGLGHEKAPGRFGFMKGDGVLDCAIPLLGVMDKMYLLGDPRYKKPFKWTYCTLPEGMKKHGSLAPAEVGIEEDYIEVNPLSVKWSAENFSQTYSLGTSGIISEFPGAESMQIGMLEYASNYQYMMLPVKDGYEVRDLSAGKIPLALASNHILFFGSTEFPDIPLMVTFTKEPSSLEICRDEKSMRLTKLVFHGVDLFITSTPFGFESLEKGGKNNDREFLLRAEKLCRFWSRALLAYPVACKEYFKWDREKEEVKILQKFSYRILEDAWGTVPLKIAVYPPAATLSTTAVFDEDSTDFAFPTKYGYLQGRLSDSCSYTIPCMPTERAFPLAEKDSPALDIRKYLDFHSKFPPTIQSYPYAGSLMEPYALVTTMMNFIPEKEKEELRHLARERLKMACEKDRMYDYPIITHSEMMKDHMTPEYLPQVYFSPEMEHIRLWNWYERKEPFTGASYNICYLNVGFFSGKVIREGTREEVANLNYPLIENDWGAGLTFYYMYLCSLACGDLTAVKENWQHLQSVWSFFEKMQDFACMGTGYSDNAVTWVEGANYGVFTGYINLARNIGNEEALEKGVYLGAKQMCLRFAIFRAAQHYFHKFFNRKPYYLAKFFHEEQIPSYAFQNVPALQSDRYRTGGIYNLTTEGLYPELFAALKRFLPQEFRKVKELVTEELRRYEELNDHPEKVPWSIVQENTSLAIMDHSLLEEVEKRNRLIKEWRGIHIFSRYLPEEYFRSQILAWRRMTGHPLWLENWYGVYIEKAFWDREERKAVIHIHSMEAEQRLLSCGFTQMPSSFAFTGKNCSMERRKGHLSFTLEGSGILTISFPTSDPNG